ncbi:MAG: alpha-L-fucosidase, partial [Victivallaceae bacterium]|nr:alpha-L-fucosidase [Victivallaceae bacterium]
MTDFGKGDTGWFVHDRFGMFIHFGLYSLAARHEWVRNVERITQDQYQKYFDMFNPDLFKPAEWAKAAREAGMKYFVITTKHHEGFCLWDTKYTDYKVTNTAFGRDLLREVVDAFRAEGLKVGLYYSLLDWHHPDFTIDPLHPQRDLPEAEIEKMNSGRDMARYRKYMLDQITELLTGYGKIDIMWFDFSYNDPDKHGKGKGREAWGSEDIVRLIRRLAPWVIIDNRLDLPGSGDIYTPEQYTPDEQPHDADGKPLVWE